MASISWLHGVSGDWTTAADWNGGAVPGASDSVTINATGTYTVTLFSAAAVGSMTLNAPGATFYDAGSLALGGLLSLQSGTLALAYGSLVGGTLAMAGGTLLAGGGLLDGVAVQGTLDLSRANASLSVRDGMVLSGAGGVGAGSIALTGGYADLGYQGSQTLDHAVVTIGAASVQPGQGGAATLGITHLSNATSGATLTLGSGLWLHEAAGQAVLAIGALGQLNGLQLPDEMLNLGTITCDSAGSTLTVAGSGTLVNQGTIAISGGATLNLDEAGFADSGHISVSNGTLGLGGTFSASRLGSLGNLTLSQATLEIVGTADNTGGTLTVGTSGLGPITLAGTILNGIVLDTGGGLLFGPATGILDGTTYQGTLSLAAAGSAVTLTDGAHVVSAGGGAGTIAVTGAGSALLLRGIDTLDNATISLGNAGSAAVIGTNDAFLASTATTATLGAHLSVVQAGLYAALDANAWSPIPNFGLSDTLVNQGTITGAVAGGTLAVSGYGTFVNQGTIAVSNGDSLAVTVANFANAGTLSVGGGASATLGAGGGSYTPVWSNAGLISVNGGTLTLAGAMRTSQLGSITVASGSVTLAGTLSNAGSTLTLGAGAHGPGSLAAASLTGTIQGGTIVDASGALAIGTGGTALLDGVSYQGSLSLTQAGAYLRVRDGLSLTGTAAVTGAGSVLAFQGTQSFDHARVLLGASGTAASIDVVHDYGGQGGSTLTLGAGLSIVETGALASIGLLGDAPVDAIVNQGSISGAVSGGMLSIGGADFINQGNIAVSNGDTLVLAAAAFSNSGTIGVSNAALSIAGSTTLAGLGHLVLSNAAVSVSGTLDSTGTTLAIGTGTAIGRLGLSGTLRGGTILDTGSGLGCVGSALLDGVAYRGTLDLSRPFAQLSLADGIVLSDISGTQPGSVLLTGAASRIVTTTSQTLDNATIMIGAPATQYGGQRLPAPELAAAAGTTLTLGAHAVVRSAAAYATLGDSALGRWTDAIVNDGQILSSTALGTLTLGSSFFTNAGTIAVVGGGGVLDASTGFTNTGTISIGAGSNFWVSLYDYFAAPNAGATVFTNAGTIQMQGGLFQELTAGGLFPPVPIANQAGGLIQGTGIVFSQIVNAGTIESHGGALALLQSITGGSGGLLIDPNSTLEFGNAVPASEVVTFTDTGTGGILKLDQPGNFAAPIAGYTMGDLIELPGVQLTSVGNASGTLVVSSATHTWRLPTTTPLAGAFSAGRDARGDATIAITPQTMGGPQAVLSVYQPGMLFWCSPAGDEFQGVTANLNGDSIGNWSAADSLDLTDMIFGSAHLAYSQGSNAGTLTLSDGSHTALVSITGSFPGAGFHLASDGHGGTLVTYSHP